MCTSVTDLKTQQQQMKMLLASRYRRTCGMERLDSQQYPDENVPDLPFHFRCFRRLS
jgi:hypothetical protein